MFGLTNYALIAAAPRPTSVITRRSPVKPTQALARCPRPSRRTALVFGARAAE